MRNKLITILAIPILLYSTASFAVIPAVFYLASLGLHLAAGAAYMYFSRDVTVPNASYPTRVYLKTKDDTSVNTASLPSPAPDSVIQPPSSVPATYVGGTATYTFPPVTSNGYTYPGTTVTAPIASFLFQLKNVSPSLAPNNPFRANLSDSDVVSFSFYNSAPSSSVIYYGSNQQVPQYTHILTITRPGYYPTYYRFKIDNVELSCPAGYLRDASNAPTCFLYDAAAAKAAGGGYRDYKCEINAYGGNGNTLFGIDDQDCKAIVDAGLYKVEQDDKGESVHVIKSSTASTETLAVKSKTDVSTGAKAIEVSTATRSADGSAAVQTATVAASTGVVSSSVTTTFPPSPVPPQYPGQVNTVGTSSGSSGSGSTANAYTGSTCGGPGQPACKVEFSDGSGSFDTSNPSIGTGSGTGQGDDANAGFIASTVSRFEQFKLFQLPIQSLNCTAGLSPLDTSIDFYKQQVPFEVSSICPAVESYEDFIKLAAQLGWSLAAVFLIISRLSGSK